jgi:hypothetical protein
MQLIDEELERADLKFPDWPTDPVHALGILSEEYGELSKEVLQMVYEPHKTSLKEIEAEAVQTAAMAIRFLISLERYEFVKSKQHIQRGQNFLDILASGQQRFLEKIGL